ncbi:MAG: hypothetical protein ACSLFQ_20605 [Thermoanaerobaculia bacterium]
MILAGDGPTEANGAPAGSVAIIDRNARAIEPVRSPSATRRQECLRHIGRRFGDARRQECLRHIGAVSHVVTAA